MLDRSCARHLSATRSGRRNGAYQSNRETAKGSVPRVVKGSTPDVAGHGEIARITPLVTVVAVAVLGRQQTRNDSRSPRTDTMASLARQESKAGGANRGRHSRRVGYGKQGGYSGEVNRCVIHPRVQTVSLYLLRAHVGPVNQDSDSSLGVSNRPATGRRADRAKHNTGVIRYGNTV